MLCTLSLVTEIGRVQVRGGAVRLTRLGGLNFAEQSRWSRAPEPRGMWAFPFGMIEPFFFYHQWTDRLPAHLRYDADYYPLRREVLRGPAGEELDAGDTRTVEELCEADWSPYEGWHDERRAWVREVGMRSWPLRHFWYDGPVYTHLTRRGEILGLSDWTSMAVREYAEAVRRCGANRMTLRTGDRLCVARSSKDHLEVFLPRTRR